MDRGRDILSRSVTAIEGKGLKRINEWKMEGKRKMSHSVEEEEKKTCREGEREGERVQTAWWCDE